MSDRQQAQEDRTAALLDSADPNDIEEGLARIENPPEEAKPVLSVALGNVVLTEHGVEITFVFPKEVVFVDQPEEA